MDKVGFGTLNSIVLALYLLAMLGVGMYFTKKAGESTEAFFKAGGKVPSWAVGFSIYATTLSAITFMATPEKAFNGDWTYAAGNVAIIAIIPILIYYYVPFFRKLDVTTAYEYLEERFNPSMRVIGSILFSLFHIGRIAIVVYLPTVAITSVSTVNPYLVCAAIGILCVIYSFMGGIEGVIWTDVIQGIILLGGAILVIILDFVIEFILYMKDMMMDKQEIKREYIEQEGHFETKSRRRELHIEILSEQTKSDIRNSKLVVMNPTHIAIGIYFNPEIAPAPFISLIETNQCALAVRKYANEVGIPTVRDVKLARKLYKTHTKYSFVDFEHLDEVLRLIVWLEQVENTH